MPLGVTTPRLGRGLRSSELRSTPRWHRWPGRSSRSTRVSGRVWISCCSRVLARSGWIGPAWLAMRLERGAEADAYLSESEQQILELTRTPKGHEAWLGNTLAVIVPRNSSLDASQLTGRRTPVHVALERSALGRWTRASLREAGLWGEVALASGNFDGGEAIVERVSYFARRRPPEVSFGIVFGSDVDAERVSVVGYLDQPKGDPTIHYVAWFTEAGEDFSRWLRSDPDALAFARRAGFVPPEGTP